MSGASIATKMAVITSLLVTSLFVFSAAVPTRERNGPLVQTNFGAIRGVSNFYEDGRPYDAFFGVPFGTPLAAENRWSVAQYPEAWNGELETTEFEPYCKQLITPLYSLLGMKANDSEDCLFLNIYVPSGVQANRENNLPVIFFVYGGGFLIGASDMYPGEELALNTDAIVVTFNYRVGALGFLSTGNANAPGNYGLWDDYLALKWVKENIDYFGGDSSRITVMGQSAGAASASHLALSPYTNGLFQRYVSISGSSTSWFASTSYLPQTVRNTALLFGCPIFNQAAMLECLGEKSATALDLIGVVSPLLIGGTVPNWVPVVDGDFLPTHPREGVNQGTNSHLDVMMGYARHDGTSFIFLNFLGYNIGDRLNVAENKGLVRALFRLMVSVYDDPDALVDVIYGQYPDLDSDDELLRTQAAVQTMTDFVFASPVYYEVDAHSRNRGSEDASSRTYLYEFAYQQSFLFYEDWVQGSHVDDLHSVFGPQFLKAYREGLLGTEWNEDDKTVSRNIQSYLANFVATGNPNDGPKSVPIDWPQYNEESRQYMVQQPEFSVISQSGDQLERFNFWAEFYDNARPSATVKLNKSAERLLMLLRPHLAELLTRYQHFTNNPDDFLSFIKSVVRDLIEKY